MESVITGLVSRFGYWGVLLLIAVENIFPPIPSEVILTFGGFLTTCTEMTPPGVILFSTLGSVAGAIVLYGVGRLLAPQRLEALLSGRVGRVLKMESADVHKASDWFAAHGWPSVFYCRCIPILRSLISIPAGMAGMHPAPFLLLTTVGSLLWNILLVYLGALA
ncbi:MAG: DedA family protein, partial [Ruthenibacterium lactatiformans]